MATEIEKREAAAVRAALLRKLDGAVTEGAVARARRAAQPLKKVPTTKESNMTTISETLALSRAKLEKGSSQQRPVKAGTTVPQTTATDFLRSPVQKSRVELINGMAAERAQVRKVQPTGVGGKPATSNPNPEQVDTHGAITGGMKDPKLGEGSVNPIGVAANMDNGWAAVQEFFANRRAK